LHRAVPHKSLAASLEIGELTRRQFLGRMIGSTIGGLALSTWPRRSTLAAGQIPPANPADPTPIPGGIRNSHHFLPGRGAKVSTVNDFDGVVGIAHLAGGGTATTANGASESMTYVVDNRFMVGEYIGADGQRRSGAFAEF
jgi:hypothetical protein